MSDRQVSSAGVLGEYVEGFSQELERLGYSQPAAAHKLRMVAGLGRWMETEGLGLSAVGSSQVEPFFAARRAAGQRLRTLRSVAALVEYLVSVDAIGQPAAEARHGAGAEVLDRFEQYLLHERGLVAGTVRCYLRVAERFVDAHAVGDPARFEHVGAAEVNRFAREVCSERGLSSSRASISALRCLLRFLHLEGRIGAGLAEAVWSVTGSAALPPRGVSSQVVDRLLASCDRTTAQGRRDRAVMLLLARLGLRAGEVVALELDDLRWRAGEITVRGKGGRRDRLPLPVEVGEAVASYLHRGRPATDERRVFLSCQAPMGPMSPSAVAGIMQRASRVAGVPCVSPHRLRHTVATEMLAAGASLSEIGQVLRHSDVRTTSVYAAVDHAALGLLARPWPGERS